VEETLTVDETPDRVPLMKKYGPPPEPPMVELVRWRGGRAEMVQQGVPYAGEWVVQGRLERAGEPLPMPWPEATSVAGEASLFVSFGDVSEP
jgi:hypothetical protein